MADGSDDTGWTVVGGGKGRKVNDGASGSGNGDKEGNGGDRRKGDQDAPAVVYGQPGKHYCMICRAKRDHLAVQCPGNVCRRCNLHGHFAFRCKTPYCPWCGGFEHTANSCPARFNNVVDSHVVVKRKADERAEQVNRAPKTFKSSGSAWQSCGSEARGDPNPIMGKVSSFLEEMKGGGMMSEVDYNTHIEQVNQKRKEVQRQYDMEMHKLAVQESNIQREYKDAQAFREVIEQLALVQNQLTRGQASQPAPESIAVETDQVSQPVSEPIVEPTSVLSIMTQSTVTNSVPVKTEDLGSNVVQSPETQPENQGSSSAASTTSSEVVNVPSTETRVVMAVVNVPSTEAGVVEPVVNQKDSSAQGSSLQVDTDMETEDILEDSLLGNHGPGSNMEEPLSVKDFDSEGDDSLR